MRVADRRPGALKPLADVRADILKTLQTQQRSAVISQWLGKLRAKAFLRYYARESDVTARSQDRVVKIVIAHMGVSTVSDAVIRSHLRVKEGELATQTSVDHDIRSLYETGDFSNIRVAVQTTTGGINLTCVVQERPMLTGIQFTGNTNISSSELLQNLTSKTGERMDERKLFNDSQKIQVIYRMAGYPLPAVKYVPRIEEKPGCASITFEVTEIPQKE
jgi:outer membrane protein insertion porin family